MNSPESDSLDLPRSASLSVSSDWICEKNPTQAEREDQLRRSFLSLDELPRRDDALRLSEHD